MKHISSKLKAKLGVVAGALALGSSNIMAAGVITDQQKADLLQGVTDGAGGFFDLSIGAMGILIPVAMGISAVMWLFHRSKKPA